MNTTMTSETTMRRTLVIGTVAIILAGLAAAGVLSIRMHEPAAGLPEPPWRSGNAFFQAANKEDWATAAATCSSASSAQEAQSTLTVLARQYGPLGGWGSNGPGNDYDPSVKTASQLFQIRFGSQNVNLMVEFVRGPNGGWQLSHVAPVA